MVIYWSHTLKEIQDYVRLKYTWWQARAFQDYEVLAIILSQAFGGKPKGSAPKTKDEAKMQLAGLFKK